MSLSERTGQFGRNAQVTFVERIMVLAGVPSILAMTGWVLLALNTMQADVARLTATMNAGFEPRLAAVERGLDEIIRDRQDRPAMTERQAERLEDRLGARLSRLEGRLSAIERLPLDSSRPIAIDRPPPTGAQD